MEAPSDDEDFDLMLSDTVSGSVFLLAVTFAWRDLPQEKRDASDPLKVWDSMTATGKEIYLASARRFRDALIEVEDAIDPRLDQVMAA